MVKYSFRCFILTLVFLFGLSLYGLAGNSASLLKIDIHLDKEGYFYDETVSGTVVVASYAPVTHPSTFKVSLLREGQVNRTMHVNTPVFMGATKFSLDNFGLKDFNSEPHKPGMWDVVITTSDDPPVKTKAGFLVVGDDNGDK